MDPLMHTISTWRTISSLSLLALLLIWESLLPFFNYFVGSGGGRTSHGLKNLLLGAFNSVLTGLGFVTLWGMTARWAQVHDVGLLNWLPMPGWARVAGAFLLFDAWMYWWHRFNHRIPF